MMNRPDNRAIRGLMLCLLVIFLSGCIGEQTTLTPANTAVSSPTSQPEPSPSAVAPVTEVSEAETADSDVEDEQVAATAVPSPTGAAEAPIAAELAGLPIDVFFEESYNMLLLRDPELITEAGLVDFFGTGNDQLTDISDSYIRETQALEKAILDLLHTYDRASLTPEQQISYDIYEWFLDDQVRQHEFMYYNYPVTFFITAVHVSLTQFFTDIHPVTNRQDAEDYITRLSQVDIKFDQLLEGLRLREEAGIIPPRFAIQWTIPGIRQIAAGPARSTPYYAVFADKVNALAELNDADKEALLSAAEQEINQSVLPAFQDLLSYMEALEGKATDDAGVWRLPDGDAFYAYALRHHTTTDMS
jgi:uncharacterized protein (DUF885 family)